MKAGVLYTNYREQRVFHNMGVHVYREITYGSHCHKMSLYTTCASRLSQPTSDSQIGVHVIARSMLKLESVSIIIHIMCSLQN